MTNLDGERCEEQIAIEEEKDYIGWTSICADLKFVRLYRS